MIGKAVRQDALPVLVCRKVFSDLYLLFKRIGGMAFQMHGQLFPEDFAARLARAKHSEGLGFHDIRFGDTPSPPLVHFIGTTVPRHLAGRLAIFRAHASLLRRYAIDLEMEDDDMPGERRRDLYRQFEEEVKAQ